MTKEKKNKVKGIFGTVLFHVLLLLLLSLPFMSLKYQDPPPEKGISINLGYMDEGMTETEPEDKAEIPEPVQEEIVEEQSSAEDEVISQETKEATVVEKTEQKKKEPDLEKEEVIEKKKPKVKKETLYTGKKKNKETDQGNTEEIGNKGAIDGDPNAKAYTGGGIGTDGITYELGGRSPEFKAEPVYEIQEEGTVVVLITVDRSGNVMYAEVTLKGSDTSNQYLWTKAKEAAMKTTFSPKQSAPETHIGKITYHFSLK